MQSRHATILLLTAFAIACTVVVPFVGIGASWRECDTQAMSLSMATESFDVLRPRVDWRGDTDGGVESEMPLYQALVAALLLLVGDTDWPGRFVSLGSTLLAALAFQGILRRSAVAPVAAAAGSAAFLASGAAVLTACRVMPDAASLCAALWGWNLLDRWLRGGANHLLWLATLCTTAGCLAKPTSLQVVLVQAGWVLATAPVMRWRPAVLTHLAVPCIATLGWLLHAHGIHQETGLTFGVLAEGDSKVPDLDHLLAPGLHYALARNALLFGPGVAGYAAFAVLLLCRRVRAVDAVVLVPVGLALFATMRYSATAEAGPHYHLWAAVGGGWAVARCWSEFPSRRVHWALGLALLGTAVASLLRERTFRLEAASSPVLLVAAAVRDTTAPHELVAVRSAKLAHDAFWDRPNNYEDPIVLHHARRKGWVLSRDGWHTDQLDKLRTRGCRVLVDQAVWDPAVQVREWLGTHASEVWASEQASVHRLRP